MKVIQKLLFAFLGVIFVIHLGWVVFGYRSEYTSQFDPSYWKERFEASQWRAQVGCGDFDPHINPKTCKWDDIYYETVGKHKEIEKQQIPLGDDGLYAYAGWNYITGGDPTLLNAELPPLGKYMIGAGEIIFGNQNILVLIIGLLCLLIFYLLNLKLFKNKLLAFVPVALFSFDPLFTSQLRAPYLDTTYLLFLLLSLYFTLQRKYLLVGLFLGCFAAIKFPIGSVFLFLPIAAWVYLFDKKHLKTFLISMLLWPFVFIASYAFYFINGGSFIGFLGVQKWIINFYTTGTKATYGIVYPMILFGTWHTWFGGVQKVSEWTIFWPVSFIGSIFACAAFLIQYIADRKIKIEFSGRILIAMWVLSYLVFLTFTPVFPRYLLLLLPFMYNLTIWFLTKYVFQRYLSS